MGNSICIIGLKRIDDPEEQSKGFKDETTSQRLQGSSNDRAKAANASAIKQLQNTGFGDVCSIATAESSSKLLKKELRSLCDEKF